jgi:hypothetical protein
VGLIGEKKNRVQKSRDTVPLTTEAPFDVDKPYNILFFMDVLCNFSSDWDFRENRDTFRKVFIFALRSNKCFRSILLLTCNYTGPFFSWSIDSRLVLKRQVYLNRSLE